MSVNISHQIQETRPRKVCSDLGVPVFVLEELCIAAGSTVQIEASYHDNIIVLEYHILYKYK